MKHPYVLLIVPKQCLHAPLCTRLSNLLHRLKEECLWLWDFLLKFVTDFDLRCIQLNELRALESESLVDCTIDKKVLSVGCDLAS